VSKTIVHGVETGFNKVESGFETLGDDIGSSFSSVERGVVGIGKSVENSFEVFGDDVMKGFNVVETGAKFAFNEVETIGVGLYDFAKPFVMIGYRFGKFVEQNPQVVIYGIGSFLAFKYINEGKNLLR
jgi:hypothetical protein